ncbi:MAG: AI-2E family transporter [Nitrospirae bacterium]|nr:AI-2E family transporter [Nitrospirota bacterium]
MVGRSWPAQAFVSLISCTKRIGRKQHIGRKLYRVYKGEVISAENKIYRYTIVSLLLALFGYLNYSVLEPFLKSIGWALVLSIIFYPVYLFLHKYIVSKWMASVLTILIVVFIITGPLFYIVSLLANELNSLVVHLKENHDGALTTFMSYKPVHWLIDRFHLVGTDGRLDIGTVLADNFSQFGQKLAPQVTTGLMNVFSLAFNVFIMLFVLYFFFKDGDEIIERVKDSLPFSHKHKAALASQIKDMVVSAIYGSVVLSITQGLVSGLTFYFVGLGQPVLLGATTALFSFVPMGAAFAWAGVAIFLFISGLYIKGVITAVIGLCSILFIDNMLVPIIMSGRTKVSTLVVFLTVIGGIHYFGLIGLIMGPLVYVVFISLFNIFRNMEDNEMKDNEMENDNMKDSA